MIYLTWLIMDSSFFETSSTFITMSEVYCLTNATGLLTGACFSFLSSMHQFRAAPESLRRLRARLLSLDSPTKRTSSDTDHLPRSRTARRFFPVCTCWQLIHCHPIVRPRAYTLAATVIQSSVPVRTRWQLMSSNRSPVASLPSNRSPRSSMHVVQERTLSAARFG